MSVYETVERSDKSYKRFEVWGIHIQRSRKIQIQVKDIMKILRQHGIFISKFRFD